VNIDFPYSIDGRNRTSRADRAEHVRDLIEQLLLTSAGERVMRPDFGSGVLALVFEPVGPEFAGSMQYLLHSALELWLADVVRVDALEATADGAVLTISLTYTDLATSAQQNASFALPSGGVG
jgi:phage baseplate assembly protein W